MKKYNPPLVTVIIPIYNAGAYLSEALDSIMNQTFTNFEVLLINDGSTDDSNIIIDKYKKKYKNIKVINNRMNLGLIATLNKGLEVVKSKYIARMDSDDIASIDRLRVQVEYMENNPEIDISGTWIEVFGKYNYLWKTPITHDEIVAKLMFECSIAHPSVMLKTNSLKRYNLKYPIQYKNAEDYGLWMLASRKLKFANIPQTLLRYRTHNRQIGFSEQKSQQVASQRVRIKQVRRLLKPTSMENLIHAKLGSWVPLTNFSELITTTKWLYKLHASNVEKHIYSVKIFDQILSARLFVELIISKNVGWYKWVMIILSPYAYNTVVRIILAKYYPSKFEMSY
ncbi:MAG: hypothetical protein Fur0011_5910 [Candidatus Microgenomates bacterium]